MNDTRIISPFKSTSKVIRALSCAALFVVLVASSFIAQGQTNTNAPMWRDADKPMDERIRNLISLMTLEEKAAQICERAPAIPRIGLPAYDYWNECLHGVARAGIATVFPQAIGMAATWNTPLIHEVADVIATEARAKHRAYADQNGGNSVQYTGLSFWTPNINIFRDPRWGRGQETYGEDTFLTARIGVAFIQGLQGNDPKYVKAMACAKHFAVHSGPEVERHRFNVVPSERDLYETYLPHFEAAVREGKVGAVMGAYNRVNGEPACSSTFLLMELLRTNWGFEGHVVSDCGAINDIYQHHKIVNTMEEAEARAVKAGCDLGCWGGPAELTRAVKGGLMTERDMEVSLARVLKTRFQLGMFDPPERVPYSKIPASANDTPEHGRLALRTALESIVLLKNDGVLPLDRSKIKRVAVIGMNAPDRVMMLGNYNGIPSRAPSILEGIASVGGTNVQVSFAIGCSLALPNVDSGASVRAEALSNAVAAAKSADAVIYVGGLSPRLENEEADVPFQGFANGDRLRIELPSVQTDMLKALHATGKPVVFVNCSGSAVAMPWEAENLAAIVQAWYPGQAGGIAVAQVLFGEANPGGRLPVTFYRASSDLPEFTDYSMSNRTYRYFGGKPLFAFGRGLSYTTFEYRNSRSDKAEAGAADTIRVTLQLANTGARDGDEVVQVYFRHVQSAVAQPLQALCGFKRVPVARGQSASVEIAVPLKEFRYWDTAKKQYVVEPGRYELLVGAASDDIRAKIPLTIVASR